MAAAAAVLLELALLTQTRASVVALPLTLVVFLALTPNRARAIVFSLPAAVAVAATARPVLHVFTALQRHEGVRDAVVSARNAVLVSAAVLVVVGALAAVVDRCISLAPRSARVGSLAVGKQADLVVIDGDPSTTIADVRKVQTVFKQGVGFDPAKLIESVSGKVGLW